MEQAPRGLQGIERFAVTQRITALVNRYDIRAVASDGRPGALLATAQQKRVAFEEQVTFYADEARTEPVFSFKARQRRELALGAQAAVVFVDDSLSPEARSPSRSSRSTSPPRGQSAMASSTGSTGRASPSPATRSAAT